MKNTIFLSLAEALELHVRLIERFGGKVGVRDRGLLESALMRPTSGYYESLSTQAAALLQSLALNHPFLDGNKRVAFAGMAIFLKMNGFSIQVDAETAEIFLIEEIIKGRADLDVITTWIERHISPYVREK